VHLPVDGALAVLRPLVPDEPERIREVFDELSDRSRYLRFHTATPRLTTSALRHLATVRACERGAVVAMVGVRAVGLAQWARYDEEPGVADLAVAVGDRHQRRGLGGALVATATRAAIRAGVSHIAATVHPESHTVVGWLRGAGAVPRPGHTGEVLVEAGALVRQVEAQRLSA
jgi:predicted N-acetyltransferase YhbS